MSKIIVSIDNMKYDSFTKLQKQLEDNVYGYKVRSLALNNEVKTRYAIPNLMLDMKFFDIPSSIMEILLKSIDLGYDICTVHMTADFKGNSDINKFIAGVSILTSFSIMQYSMYYKGNIIDTIKRMHDEALEYKYGYFVCSAQDLEFLDLSDSIKYICPGIRFESSDKHDQERVMTPIRAVQAGADYLVIGRMITQAVDPLETVKKINLEVENTLHSSYKE